MNTIWQFELDGYDSSTDATDDKIIWVAAPTRESATAYMRERGFCFNAERVVPVDFLAGFRESLAGVDYVVPDNTPVKIPFEPEVQGDYCLGPRYRIPGVVDGRVLKPIPKQFVLYDHIRGDSATVVTLQHMEEDWDLNYKNDPDDDDELTLGEWLELALSGDTYQHEDEQCEILCVAPVEEQV